MARAPLDFAELVDLINHSRTTRIVPQPLAQASGQWAVYGGEHRIQNVRVSFEVLYLYADAVDSSLRQAARERFVAGKTTVVYAPSLASRALVRELFDREPNTFYNTRQYLESFLEQELQAYRSRVKELRPTDYIQPTVKVPAGMTLTRPDPLLEILYSDSLAVNGHVAVVLAEPGQGKTYTSRHLAARLADAASGPRYFPVYIDSQQWSSLAAADLNSLAKTITHSFRYFDATIGWVDGIEEAFVRTILKTGGFRLIFDGLDEYVLWSHRGVATQEAISALVGLSEETQSPIIVTSRTSFWENEVSPLPSNVYIYHQQPWDHNQARNYFTQQLGGDPTRIGRALDMFSYLNKGDRSLGGRGFVLKLVADVVDRGGGESTSTAPGSRLMWLIRVLCEREQVRQKLPIGAEHQISILCDVSAMNAGDDSVVDGDTLRMIIQTTAGTETNLSDADVSYCLKTLELHPLLARRGSAWLIPQDQIRHFLLTEFIRRRVAASAPWLETDKVLSRVLERPDGLSAVAESAVEVLLEEASGTARLRSFIAYLIAPDRAGPAAATALAVEMTLLAIERLHRNDTREDRTRFVKETLSEQLRRLRFDGATLRVLDLRGLRFNECEFVRVTWANCLFDETTVFQDCVFTGGHEANCQGFGLATFVRPVFNDDVARAVLLHAQVRAQKRRYTADDLKSDIGYVIRKLVKPTGAIVTATRDNIEKGVIAQSRYKDEIIEELLVSVLEAHALSQVGRAAGIDVRDDAKDAVRFFGTQGVFSGPLASSFERLRHKLGL